MSQPDSRGDGGSTFSFAPASRRSANFEEVCGRAQEAASAWKRGGDARAKAREALELLCTQDPSSPLWPLMLSRVFLAGGSPADALKVCNQALADMATRSSELFLVRGLARDQLLDAGEASCETLADAKADILQARLLGGLGPAAAKELTEAIKKLEVVVPKMAPSAAPVKPAATPATASSQSGTAKAVQEVKKAPAPENNASQSARPSSSNSANSAAVAEVLKAREAEDKGLYKTARTHCQEALQLSPDLPQAVLCLARMDLAIGAFSEAAKRIKKTHSAVLKRSSPARLEALSIVAAAAEQSGDWEAALEELEVLAPLAQQTNSSPPSSAGWGPQPKLPDVLGRLARARWHEGDRNSAATLAQQILEAEQSQVQACEVACSILVDRGDSSTALALMVKCIIAHRNEPADVVSELVSGVMRRCSVEELVKVLAPGETGSEQSNSVGEVVGYAGLVMKEKGELLDASRAYRQSVLLAPDNGSLCLNLMHTFSLRRDDLRAIAWGERYFDRLASKAPAARLIAKALRGETDSSETLGLRQEEFESKSAFYDAIAMGFVLLKLLFLAHPHGALSGGQQAAAEETKPDWQVKLRKLDIEQETVGSKVSTLASQAWNKVGGPAAEELPTLPATEAHYGTLLRLSVLLEKSRQGHNLHMTPVRNEHAYFACIRDILEKSSNDVRTEAPLSTIYVVGDSHVLPTAWQTIDLPGKDGAHATRHVLVPNVVTGVKIWHLRDKSAFYTKTAFWDRISSLPKGAPVIFVLGEIDCREGILRAVQQGKHSSIEAALRAVVEVYFEVLKQVRKKLPSSQIFIHPVPNVLVETRSLTVAFNILLHSDESQSIFSKLGVKLLSLASVFKDHPNGPPSLDANELSKLELLDDVKLDGTHMSPSYVSSLLAPALEEAWQQP
eukprot:TRINITY_DN42275_c0_g1_i1.p1 TRINITY_DN42275_c0_g1~~TRINITY_DN42275_c0_g1_i1.p1  ORF type:complete len:905 (-),score=230.45 TRINITY_DN42275_c0_g1_i1:49-2763(-)